MPTNVGGFVGFLCRFGFSEKTADGENFVMSLVLKMMVRCVDVTEVWEAGQGTRDSNTQVTMLNLHLCAELTLILFSLFRVAPPGK